MSGVRSPGDLLELADRVLERVPAGSEAEVAVTENASALTRFANGGIHQNVADHSVRVRLRLIREGRCGVAEMRVAGDGIGAALVRSAETVRTRSPLGEPVPLYVPDGGTDGEEGFSSATAYTTPEQRADQAAAICAAAQARGQLAFGTCETGETAVAMVSTAGLRRASRHSVAELIAVSRGEDGSAYGARHDADISRIDVTALAAEVTERCERNQRAQPLEPGTYEVVLSPYAVAELLEYLALVGLSGLAVLEERSFMRFGERLMSETVTITDDVTRAELAPLPFDGEGASTVPLRIIESGVCRAVVHDSVTAARSGTRTTGHSLAQPNAIGPMPRYLCLDAGDTPPESMISACERALVITRFWYVRPVHPLTTIITGMTRDGTFLAAGGRVVRPVRDLRFTQSIVGALADVRGIGPERLAVRGYAGATLAPWMHLGSFAFSS